MQPYIQVKFERMARDPSVEAAVDRWVTRLESLSAPIRDAFIGIEQTGRRGTAVSLKLELADGSTSKATTSREDIYVAVADAFRAIRRQLLERGAAARPAWLGLAG